MLLNELKIYDFVGKETLSKEYKEFRLNYVYKYFTDNQIKNWLYDKTLLNINTFNSMVLNQIQNYLYNYLPKYIGNFSNSGIDGKLYFGIDDNGIIGGIPYYGDLDIDKIKKYILKISKYNQIIDEDNIIKNNKIKEYYSNIDIELIKIDIDNLEYEKLLYEKKLNDFINKQNLLKENYENYINNYNKWQEQRVLYSGKLISFMTDNNLRNQVIDYILSKINLYDFKRDNHLINKCLFRWKSDEIFDTHLYIDDIIAISSDLSHPLKWLIDFKLNKLEEIRRTKPIAPLEYPTVMNYFKFMSNINNIRYKLYDLDGSLNYYIMKINFITYYAYVSYK
jgi:hypothetical protein